MKRVFPVILFTCLLSACSTVLPEKQVPVCEATAMLGGQPHSVKIYGVRKVANQTEYKAGYPFDWRWVSKNNFTKTTCQ